MEGKIVLIKTAEMVNRRRYEFLMAVCVVDFVYSSAPLMHLSGGVISVPGY